MSTTLGQILLLDNEEQPLKPPPTSFKKRASGVYGPECRRIGTGSQGAWDFDLLITDLNMPGNRVIE
ncbi:MAG: hypothetical protein R3B83_03795 [Nitrospirales bacterium]|nr:hypothetical protein [Nitrospirales bacterium]